MARSIRVPLTDLRAGERLLDSDSAHYLTRVLRLREGARVTAFDPAARLEAGLTLLAVGRDGVRVSLGEPEPARVVGLRGVTLVQCAGKGDKVDDVVRAATALGASRIIVATSERSVARPTATPEKLSRFEAIALAAARQSGRGDVPELAGPSPLASVLAELALEAGMKLCLEPGAPRALGDALAARQGQALSLLVGPEGGLSEEELAELTSAGFERVRFGSLVLRTELAGLAALGAVLALAER